MNACNASMNHAAQVSSKFSLIWFSQLQALANENRQLQGTLNQFERDAASREAHLNSRATEALTLQEAQRSAQSQINQYLTDLQAFEKQVMYKGVASIFEGP